MLLRFGALLVAATVMIGFESETNAAEGGGIAGRRFVLTQANDVALPADREVFLEFGADLRLSGRVCNVFNGPAALKNGVLTADALASTRMLCPDPVLAGLENELLRALRMGVSAMRVGEALELRRDAFIWKFTLADAAGPTASSPSPAEKDEARLLTGRKFVLRAVDEEAFSVDMGRQPYIEFSQQEGGLRINGSACNNFMGVAEFSGGTLRMENAASTMMLCVDPKLSDFERDFHQTLREGMAVELSGDTLVLRGGGKTFTYREQPLKR